MIRKGRVSNALTLALGFLVVTGLALAVHQDGLFELDENAVAGPADGDDWDLLRSGGGSPLVFDFVEDPFEDPVNDDIFAQNSADTLNVSDWSWKYGEPTDKGDIVNAYAAAYTNDDDDVILYFGMDRLANNGDAAVGVWFLQSDVSQVEDDSPPNFPFSGTHVPGDVLVQSDFTNGGVIDRIDVYMWDCPGFFGSEADCIDEFDDAGFTAVRVGNPTSLLWRVFEGTDCDTSGGDDLACAQVNAVSTPAPWDYSYKCVGTNQPTECAGLTGIQELDVFPVATFFEGGVNLTQMLGDQPICLATFVAETRVSQSETSTLDDKALGGFDLCGTKSGTKYTDPNGDGNLADGVPLDGVTINLYKDDGSTEGELDATDTWLDDAVTGAGAWADGYYEFPDLVGGKYLVCEESTAGWIETYPKSGVTDATNTCDVVAGQEEWGYAFTIVQGQDHENNDFGNFERITKSGTKYVDPNGDGNLADGTERDGWTINLYLDDGDGVPDAGDGAAVATATTGAGAWADGYYEFPNLGPGTYFACEATASGWIQTYPNTVAGEVIDTCDVFGDAEYGYKFTAASGTDEENNDFGNFERITKSGLKFYDNDTDGEYEPAPDPQNDLPLSGWVIELWDVSGTPAFISADSTDGSGYSFPDLGPGTYAVCEVLPADWIQSFPYSGATVPSGESVYDCSGLTPNSGGAFAQFGYTFTAASGNSLTENLFGNYMVPPGCALTQGYWKTHSLYGPAAHPDDTWLELPDGPDTEFFGSGQTWYQVFWTNPKGGNAWYILAHQYMAAQLNLLNDSGVVPGLNDALFDAGILLDYYAAAKDIPKSGSAVLTPAKDRAEAIEIAGFLAAYNEGLLGVPHCGDEGFEGVTSLGLSGVSAALSGQRLV